MSYLLFSSSRRPEARYTRALVPPPPPSVDLPPPATILRFLAQEPSPAPPPPSPTPRPVSYGRNHPRHRPSPLEVLEALLHRRSASPVFFPFLGVSPAPVNGRRRRRRTCCRLWRGSEVRYRGRSAWEARTVRRSDRFLSRDDVVSSGIAKMNCGRSAIGERTVRR